MGQETKVGPPCCLIMSPDGTVRLFEGDNITVAQVLKEFPGCKLSGFASLTPTLPLDSVLSNKRTYYVVPSPEERRLMTLLKMEEQHRQDLFATDTWQADEHLPEEKPSAHRRNLSMGMRITRRPSFDQADSANTSVDSTAPPTLVQRSWTLGRDKNKNSSSTRSSDGNSAAREAGRPSLTRNNTITKNDSSWSFRFRKPTNTPNVPRAFSQSAPRLSISAADISELQADPGFDGTAPSFLRRSMSKTASFQGRKTPSTNVSPVPQRPPQSDLQMAPQMNAHSRKASADANFSNALHHHSLSMPRVTHQVVGPTSGSQPGTDVSPILHRPSLSMPRLSSATPDQGFSSSSLMFRRGVQNLGSLELTRSSTQHALNIPKGPLTPPIYGAPRPALVVPRGPLSPMGNASMGSSSNTGHVTPPGKGGNPNPCHGDLYEMDSDEEAPPVSRRATIAMSSSKERSPGVEQVPQGFDPRTPSPVGIRASRTLPRAPGYPSSKPPRSQVSPTGQGGINSDWAGKVEYYTSGPKGSTPGSFSGKAMAVSASMGGRRDGCEAAAAPRRQAHRRTASTVCSSLPGFGEFGSDEHRVSHAETMDAWSKLVAFAAAGAEVDKRPNTASAELSRDWTTSSSLSMYSSEEEASPPSTNGLGASGPVFSSAEMALCAGPLELSWQR